MEDFLWRATASHYCSQAARLARAAIAQLTTAPSWKWMRYLHILWVHARFRAPSRAGATDFVTDAVTSPHTHDSFTHTASFANDNKSSQPALHVRTASQQFSSANKMGPAHSDILHVKSLGPAALLSCHHRGRRYHHALVRAIHTSLTGDTPLPPTARPQLLDHESHRDMAKDEPRRRRLHAAVA